MSDDISANGVALKEMFFPLVTTVVAIAAAGTIRDAQCDVNELDGVNKKLRPLLKDLVKTTFFKFYRVNLFKECPFWKDDNFCTNHNCAVEVESDENVPHELNDVDFSHGKSFGLFQKCMYSEKDFCLIDNDLQGGSYVNLDRNPERFTGYSGDSAAKVWKAIYEENCFDMEEQFHMHHHNDLSHKQCVEKRIFFKLISGLHASISAHICEEWYNEKTKTWEKNPQCFKERLINHPDRLENMYFTFLVLIRSVSKLEPYLKQNAFCDGTDDWKDTKKLVNKVTRTLTDCPITFDESQLFKEEEFKLVFRDRFRNISAIMDCISCQKCRLWGKIQTLGLGTALKVLFSYGNDSSNYHLTRSEMVALIHSFNRLSESLVSVRTFIEKSSQKQKHDEREKVNKEAGDRPRENIADIEKQAKSDQNKRAEDKIDTKEGTEFDKRNRKKSNVKDGRQHDQNKSIPEHVSEHVNGAAQTVKPTNPDTESLTDPDHDKHEEDYRYLLKWLWTSLIIVILIA